MRATGNIVELRRLLAERFPQAGKLTDRAKPGVVRSTGIPALDGLLGGGLAQGELTELVGAGPGSGSAQVIQALLRQVAADRQFLALVDGADSFDVDSAEPEALARLLWIRCQEVAEAFKAADFLLRDRNFPIVVLDLKLNLPGELQKISSSVWFRFHRLLEQNRTAFLVVTPHPIVGSALRRIRVESSRKLETGPPAPAPAWARLRFKILRAPEAIEPAATVPVG